ncbi:hypothetical protein GQ54DRAFT_43206 [Martensiomyces pterosporus]|nr:hypothetical protein GQ54DRAFT_43206 [Martensiomyces pterosporus]
MIHPAAELLFSAGAVVFSSKGDRVLAVVDTRNAKEVYFPKGKIEPEETPEEAARREVEEETGFLCHVDSNLVAMETRRSEAIGKTKVIYWYRGELAGPATQSLEEHEKFRAMWIDVCKADSVLSFENDKRLLGYCLAL